MKTILYFTTSNKHSSKEVELTIDVQYSPLNTSIIEITKDNFKLANVQFELLRKGFVASYNKSALRNLEHLLSFHNIKIGYTERENASSKFYDDRLEKLKSNLIGKTFVNTNSKFILYGVEIYYEQSEQLTKYKIIDIIHIHNKKYKIKSEKICSITPDYMYIVYTENKKHYLTIKHIINSDLQKNEIIDTFNFTDISNLDSKYDLEFIKTKIEEEKQNIKQLELFYENKTILEFKQTFSSVRKEFEQDTFITQYFLEHKKHIININCSDRIKLGFPINSFTETEDESYYNNYIKPYSFKFGNIILKLDGYIYYVFSDNGLLLGITNTRHNEMLLKAYSKLAELNLPSSTMNGKLFTLILGDLLGYKNATSKLNLFIKNMK